MSKWEDLEKELLSDPETRKEFNKLAPRYAVISEFIKARLKKGMTQKDVADKIGTKQSAVARLEAGNSNPTIGFLEKIASVLGTRLTIHLR
ncbi:MAG: transcriptional regulator [Candidatus Levybacteria bacterium RIFCSPLOWO2_01_FULL_38_21]|nr:MAG: transcriptional regulator [Candidatus Levybacteria bacterium RIFCSPLOWO2_01_FULL_38_21]